jgi:hypothetical protein
MAITVAFCAGVTAAVIEASQKCTYCVRLDLAFVFQNEVSRREELERKLGVQQELLSRFVLGFPLSSSEQRCCCYAMPLPCRMHYSMAASDQTGPFSA